MAEEAPTGYYVGRPVNHDGQKAPPAPKVPPFDEQVNAQVPGYYAGKVQGKKTAAGDQSSAGTAAAAQRHKEESGFFANCFGCFSGGQTK